MKNLIFIEGASGVGKSTMAAALCEKLCDLGYTASCHLEGDSDSPLDLCWAAYLTITEYKTFLNNYPLFADELVRNVIYQGDYVLLRYQVGRTNLYSPKLHDELHKREFCYNPTNTVPLSKFTEVFLNLWTRFVESEETKQDFAIFDTSLVSHMTNDLVRNYNASEDELITHLGILLKTILSLNPIVFYFSSQNVGVRLIEARKNRGQPPPTDEQILFWEKRKQKDLPVLSKLSVESHILDISNDKWDSALNTILLRITENHETDEERRAKIYPVILSEYNPAWPEWFAEEKENLERFIGDVDKYKQLFESKGLDYKIILLKPDYETAVQRCQTRTCHAKITPDEWIRYFYDRLYATDGVIELNNTGYSINDAVNKIMDLPFTIKNEVSI